MATRSPAWPELEYASWSQTADTLHLWTQIVGKFRLSHMPWINHSWQSALTLGARGFSTGGVVNGAGKFEIKFDFCSHVLQLTTSEGGEESFSLQAEPVAEFWERLDKAARRLGIGRGFSMLPNERSDAVPFPEDHRPREYDRASVEKFWTALIRVDNILQEFRSGFSGKSSPVHFFWGSFDLALALYSGRRAPEHPGGFTNLNDLVVKEAASHEEFACGFWPGNPAFPQAAAYAYPYPEPPNFAAVELGVPGAYYASALKEFIFPYDEIRAASSPEDALLAFYQRSYDAAAKLGAWDHEVLENSAFLQELQAREQNRSMRHNVP